MSDTTTTPAPPDRGLKADATFKKAVTLLLAGLTFTTSLIVIANVRASSRGSEAGRDGRVLAIQYLTHLDKTGWNLAGEKDLLVFNNELFLLKLQAQAYAGSAKQEGDALYYRLGADRLGHVAESLAKDGELTQPPYRDPKTGGIDRLQYYQDKILVPATEIMERQEQKKAEGSFYGSKSSALTTGLAVMAVAVFLLTLSLVLSGTIRFIMAGSGLSIAAVVLVFSAVTEARSWRGISEGAIKQLAHATGILARAQTFFAFGGDSASALAVAGQAENEIDRILAGEPDYLSAVHAKARIRTLKGEALFYGGKMEESRPELEQAAAAYDRLIAAGVTPGYNYWSRGYAEYLLGRPEAYTRSFEEALKLLPEQGFRMGAVKAAGLLVSGKIRESGEALEAALEFARAKPLASDALVFRSMIQNLERFQELRPTPGMPEMIVRMKEASVSLAVFRKTRPIEEKAAISAPEFIEPIYDKWGDVVDGKPNSAFPRATARAYYQMEFKGMERGESIVRKVYRRVPGQPFWIEQLLLGRTQHWDADATEARLRGDVENILPEAGDVLASGDYRLETYVNGRLKSAGTFKIL